MPTSATSGGRTEGSLKWRWRITWSFHGREASPGTFFGRLGLRDAPKFSSRGHYRSQLLDTLLEPFGPISSRMIYGNLFQLYPYTAVHSAATGKHTTALLRQLADLLDASGKEFFYYYVYPHLWKCIRPTDVDETIAAVAHALWQFMKGADKEEWSRASGDAKKLLGDGNVVGLMRLELESEDSEVLRLHEMVRKLLKEDKMKRVGLREMVRDMDDVLERE
ncbi:hypothetical protein DOTSEDRAFT_28687 [Dothistroma septosporum NZE10]|uniref:Uncharacterized protein n=1 Tax=Dothistroma septosporum (strain NZE10 / CBS 128990) TaxID=675120 RepID=M2Y2N5_DOTSN|nr:hypothetical protein DOTSEDRAFT_28687 [Dothistroma septosporum NZE10]